MLLHRLLKQAGFTMIELLVVIAVLGILAAAVLSAINPIEQINKGRDTGHRSDAEQLISAVDRYFALHELYPWNDPQYNTTIAADGEIGDALPGANAGGGVNCPNFAYQGTNFCIVPNDGAAEPAPVGLTTCTQAVNSSWLCALTETAEVKPAFVDRLRAASEQNALYLYKADTDTASLKVCYRPQSNGFKKEAFDNCKAECAAGAVMVPGICPGTCNAGTYTKNADAALEEMICL